MKISITSTVALALALALALAAISAAPRTASAADITVVGAADTGDKNMKTDMNTDKNMDMGKNMDSDMNMKMRMRGSTSDRTAAARVKIAAMDILNKPTALINKNTLAMDNNVFVSRSNIVFSQSDRLALAKKVEDVLERGSSIGSVGSAPQTAAETADTATEAHDDTSGDASKDMATAVLTKNVLRAVSGKDTDAALMSKASAVVAAKDDAVLRGQRIADLVDAVFDQKAKVTQATTKANRMNMDKDMNMNMDMDMNMDAEMDTTDDASLPIEQTVQTDVPRGVVVLVGTKDILRQSTAAVNKNFVMSDNQVAISRSRVSPTQNDKVMLSSGAKVADAVLPGSAVRAAVSVAAGTGMSTKDTKESATGDDYRVGFVYRKETETGTDTDTKTKHEQFGPWGVGGWGFGWRYPLGYWNLYGAGLYGGGCGLGLACGSFFYC